MKKEQQTYIAISIGVAVFFFVYFKLFLSPINERIEKTKKEIGQVTETLNNAKKEASGLDALKLKSALLDLEVEELKKKLPKSKDLPDFLRRLVRNADRFDIKISNIGSASLQAQPEYDELVYGINFTANYHSLGHFLAEIGQEERLISTRNLKINASVSANKDITVSGTFNVIAYITKPGR